MKLHNLPKDILVELVSELQDRKEKEYSEYVIIYTGVCDQLVAYNPKSEYELKGWILVELASYCSKDICENERIWLFLEELRKIPKTNYGGFEYCNLVKYYKHASPNFEVHELIDLLQKSNNEYIIIKGKCLTNNLCFPSFHY